MCPKCRGLVILDTTDSDDLVPMAMCCGCTYQAPASDFEFALDLAAAEAEKPLEKPSLIQRFFSRFRRAA